MRRLTMILDLIVLMMLPGIPAAAADWPTWRFDPSRSACSPENLPESLELLWVRELPPLAPAWPNEPRLHFDGVYEPVVVGKRLLVGSSLDGSVVALDTSSGELLWKFFTEGPVRFAPVAWKDKVYAGSDDGYVYCLDVAAGKLLWKVRGAPDDRPERRHLGNNRLISFWPVRGGPVLADGTLYFAAGVWPTMGVFVVAVDAQTGKLLWRNDRLDHIARVRLDHNHLDESGLSPQGYLVVQGDLLLVPNGRSMPAGLDRRTGELLYYVQGYRNGDCRVIAADQVALVGETGAVDVRTGREVGSRWMAAGNDAPDGFDGTRFHLYEGPIHPYKMIPGCTWQSVLCDGLAYGLERGVLYAYDLRNAKISEYETKWQDRVLKPWRWDPPLVWKLATPESAKKPAGAALIRAGNRLYGQVGKNLVAFKLPDLCGAVPTIAWSQPLDAPSVRLLAADGRLFAAGSDGTIRCFGAKLGGEVSVIRHPRATSAQKDAQASAETVTQILKQSKINDGYCVALGLQSGTLVEQLLRQSQLKLIGVDPDPATVNGLREQLVAEGLYGSRAEVFVGDSCRFPLPPYLASLIIAAEADFSKQLAADRLFDILRPYGGTACLLAEDRQEAVQQWLSAAKLPGAQVERAGQWVLLRRAGPLAGSASWTHECADAARSYFSKDERVKPPLGILWYGDGPDHGFWKHKDYGTGVKPQVIGGRLFAFQIHTNKLYAYDVYTGRVLWQQAVDPLTRYASLDDGIYVAGGDRLRILDPATGAERAAFTLDMGTGQRPFVADVRVGDDVVVVAVAPKKVRVIEEGLWDSTMLIALDRRSGKCLWRLAAKDRFNNHAIALSRGMVFAIDSVAPIESEKAKRHGELPRTLPSTLSALDARTGQVRWTVVKDHPYRTYGVGSWLGMRANDDWLAYSETCDLLLAGKHGRAYAFEAATGKPVWEAAIGGQPWILCGETLITQSGAVYQTRTGKPTGKQFTLTRGGCNYAVASAKLLLLRDRSVCFVDLSTTQKQALFAARSGCSNSLIAADGLLNAPCFSVGCVCNYPVQTSFAMIFMPEAAVWSHPVALPQAFDPRQPNGRRE